MRGQLRRNGILLAYIAAVLTLMMAVSILYAYDWLPLR